MVEPLFTMGRVKVEVARSAGFCFGVRDAFALAMETANQQDRDVYMLGHIVHNEHVVKRVAETGIQVVGSAEEVPDGATLIIRAHGTIPSTYSLAEEKALSIVDATCPLVSEIHKVALEFQEAGYRVVIIGDHDHDEVVGLAGYLHDPVIIEKPEEVPGKIPRFMRKIGVVCQSTQDIENVQAIVSLLLSKCRELRFANTICAPTTQHQRDIRVMPLDNDLMIIVGSFTSANTCRLTSISKKINPRTYQVESAKDLDPEWFRGVQTIGVSGGASTPDEIIQEVVKRIEELTQ